MLLISINSPLQIRIQTPNVPQFLNLFLLPPGNFLMPLVFADVLLHCFYVRPLCRIADVFCEEALNIDYWFEGDSPFQHSEDSLRVNVPPREDVRLVVLMAVVHFSVGLVLAGNVGAKRRNIHRQFVDDKTVIRNLPGIDKKPLLPGAVVSTVEDDPDRKRIALPIVIELTSDVA